MSSSPIFVVGASRSGTTLTTEILSRHSQISTRGAIALLKTLDNARRKTGAPVGEDAARDAVLHRVRAFYAEYKDPKAQADVEGLIRDTDVAGRLLAAGSYGEMSRIFLDAEIAYAGKRRWARHSTGSLFDLAGTFSGFPDAKVILCTRHPLDYLVSYRDSFKRAQRRDRGHEVERLRRLYHPLITSLLWVAGMRAARKALERHPGSVLLSRYEDLVTDPEGSIRRICAFVECEFERGMLEIDRNNSSENVSVPGIFPTSIGRWQKSLSPADAYIGQKICAGEMSRLGYPQTAISPNMQDVVWQILTTPVFAWRAARADQSWRRSRLPHITKRISALVRG